MNRFLLFLLFISVNIFAQDQIFKKDNTKIEAKVLELSTEEIKYKLKANPNGPLYVVKKSEVALIIYENGMHETFPDSKQQTQTIYVEPKNYYSIDSSRILMQRMKEQKFLSLTKKNNVLFINTFDLLNSMVSLSYFRELGENIFHIHAPLSFSFNEPSFQNYFGNYYSWGNGGLRDMKIIHKSIDAGLGIYINTSGKRAVSHFIGPLIRFVQYNGVFRTYSNPPYYYSQYGNTTHGFVLNQTICMLNTGVLFRFAPNMNLMINGAAGLITNQHFVANNPDHFSDEGNYYNGNQFNSFQFGFQFGYRF